MGLRRQRREVDVDGIAAECEAFLAGRSAKLLDHHRRAVPAWAWVNVLAHAEFERLVDVAVGERYPWRQRRSRQSASLIQNLAAAVLRECARTGVALRELQWQRLLPLEESLFRSGAFVGDEELSRLVLGEARPSDHPTGDHYPAPAIGRNMGNGRFNRAMLMILGPPSITSQPRR